MARHNVLSSYLPTSSRAKRGGSIVAIGAIDLAGAALLANRRAAKAERGHPARGAFVSANGVRLHYVERGSGSPVVFLHGNGGMVDDMLISGIVDHAAQSHRAIVFDRRYPAWFSRQDTTTRRPERIPCCRCLRPVRCWAI